MAMEIDNIVTKVSALIAEIAKLGGLKPPVPVDLSPLVAAAASLDTAMTDIEAFIASFTPPAA
jgi:hypothetical protein